VSAAPSSKETNTVKTLARNTGPRNTMNTNDSKLTDQAHAQYGQKFDIRAAGLVGS